MNSVPRRFPILPLDVDPQLTEIHRDQIEVGKYYFVRINVINLAHKQEIMDLFIQVLPKSTDTKIVGSYLNLRDYIKHTDLNPALHVVVDLDAKGKITDFTLLDTENKEVASYDKSEHRLSIMDKEEYYITLIEPLEDKLASLNDQKEIDELKALIEEYKETWATSEYVKSEEGHLVPGEWKTIDDRQETHIPIKYIGDFPSYGYKFYAFNIAAPAAGGSRRSRRRRSVRHHRTLRRVRKHSRACRK